MFWLVGAMLGALVIAALAVGGLFLYYAADPRLPRLSSARDYHPRTVTQIVDRNGVLIGEVAVERRTVVPFERMPKQLIQAVIAAEDQDFFKHGGLDYWGVLRAIIANLRAGRFVQGGSTITQQVVKTFFLSPARTIRRKVQEVVLAQRMERVLNKDEILYLYLNQIYFGHGRYGVQEASHFYFDKDVDQLGVAECALLAGLPQGPELLSPLKHPEAAKRRQTYVLSRMAHLGFISPQVAKRLIDEPIRVRRRRYAYYNVSPELNDIVRAKLVDAFGEQALATLGVKVRTTLNAPMQRDARAALQWGLRQIDGRHGYGKPIGHADGAARRRLLRRWAKRRARGKVRSGDELRALVTAVDDARRELTIDLGTERAKVRVSAERYNPKELAASKRFTPGDVITVRARERGKYVFDPGPQAALVALDPRTGEVLALVGGYNFHAGDFDRAQRALRQPGSAFKPMVYGAALESGRYTPATIVDDAPVVYKGWTPHNFDNAFRGRIRLRSALAQSVNTIAVRLIEDVGVDTVRSFATRLGITTSLGRDLSLALGSSGVRPIELATAYSAIANGGKKVEPRYILRIGKDAIAAPESVQVLRPEVAFVLESMMSSVVREGTAQAALRLGRPVAGKTGTTDEQRDAWFVGFTPQLLTAVWVGFDVPRNLGRGESGSRAALSIWLRFMREALRGKPKLPFAQPPGVVVARIDPESGLLARIDAPNAIEEVFVAGTEPTQTVPDPEQVDPATILMGPATP